MIQFIAVPKELTPDDQIDDRAWTAFLWNNKEFQTAIRRQSRWWLWDGNYIAWLVHLGSGYCSYHHADTFSGLMSS
jgi:hypothetical protein